MIRLALADAHREAGDDTTARITEITARLLALNVSQSEIWTLDRSRSEKGHAAKKAQQVLGLPWSWLDTI